MVQKRISKLKIPYEVYLEDTLIAKYRTLEYLEEPIYYSLIYVKPGQKIQDFKLEIPAETFGLYHKKEVKLIYKVAEVDVKNKKIIAKLAQLDLNHVVNSNLTLRYPANITINHQDPKKFSYSIKVLIKKKLENRILNKQKKKKLATDIVKYLESESYKQKYADKKALFLDILNKKFQADLLSKVDLSYQSHVKNIIVTVVK